MSNSRILLKSNQPVDLKKTKEAWRNMQKLGKEISRKWSGPSAVEEIRDQRTKKW